MIADPLSDILTAFDMKSHLSGGITAGGDWAIRFAPPQAIKFGVLQSGSCWHQVEGCGPPVRLAQGDVFVVNGLHPLRLASDPAVEPIDADTAFANTEDGMAILGCGDTLRLLGGHVELDPTGYALLSGELPPFIHIGAATQQAGILAWLLDRLIDETVHARPGRSAITRPLAQLLFVHVLREHIERGGVEKGWLRAAGDARIAPAMSLMHADPARNWRLAELARAVGMSRSSFAERFRSVCGMPPLSYLTLWRMRLAEGALRDGAPSLSALSASLGYASESAFSTAFKRIVGMAPSHYRYKTGAAELVLSAE
ncbi:MAG: AraC family transcriptional regulator [Salaquimonas sp.]|nr:AraC family transcriptional regulator [Salaquimonas sp.]